MREGLIFEALVLGEKEGTDMKELIGRKKPETIKAINRMAEKAVPIFKRGDAYVKLRYETDNYILAGEADFIGHIEYTNEFGKRYIFNKCIADLKKTGDIPKIWEWKATKEDFLQSIMYVYIHYKNTGEMLPFVYVVVEDAPENPIILCKPVIIQEKDFNNWYLPFIEAVANDMFYEADAQMETCVKGDNGARCWYIRYCKQGRNFIGRLDAVDFSYLFSNHDYKIENDKEYTP